MYYQVKYCHVSVNGSINVVNTMVDRKNMIVATLEYVTRACHCSSVNLPLVTALHFVCARVTSG